MMHADPRDARTNRLLAALPGADFDRLRPHLEPVSISLTHTFYEPGAPITDVYFLTSAVASLVLPMPGGAFVEVGTVGNEGMVGISVFVGVDTTPLHCLTQVPGAALRMQVTSFTHQLTAGSALYRLLQRYTQALLIHVMQSTLCNRLHALKQRCCRWLLMTHDRVRSDTFSVTVGSLGRALDMQPAAVHDVTAALQKAGLIRYRQGVITILDRAGLEAGSCACYRLTAAEFDRLLG